MSVFIKVEDTEYIIKRKNNTILLNGKKLITNYKDIIDDDEKLECQKIYKNYIESGMQSEYANIKAALNNAQYCEIGLSPPIEFIDNIILYLMGYKKTIEIKKDLYIIIKNDNVYLKNNKENSYFMPTTGSSYISYDYLKLLEVLITENN